MSRALETKCIHGENSLSDIYGAVSFPIYQTATFAHPGIGESTGYDYSRAQNPTREQLERVVASLENGTDAQVIDIYYADDAIRRNAALIHIHGGFYVAGKII